MVRDVVDPNVAEALVEFQIGETGQLHQGVEKLGVGSIGCF